MSSINIETPGVIKITNTSAKVKAIVPYKENFMTKIAAGAAVEIEVKTAGQALYYFGQATEGLTVAFQAAFSGVSGVEAIHCGEKITLTNGSAKVIKFIPYRENFEHAIAAGDSVVITADHVGQVLYYMAQATEGLTVAHEYVAPTPDVDED